MTVGRLYEERAQRQTQELELTSFRKVSLLQSRLDADEALISTLEQCNIAFLTVAPALAPGNSAERQF